MKIIYRYNEWTLDDEVISTNHKETIIQVDASIGDVVFFDYFPKVNIDWQSMINSAKINSEYSVTYT